MAFRRQFSDNDKAAALAALDANGGNVYRTAKELNVPRSTLQEWANGRVSHDVPELRQQKRQDLHELFLEELYAIAGLLAEKRHEATYSQLATAAGIFTDKLQLLTGQATSRADVRVSNVPPIPDDQLDHIFSE
jgi:hypothetical protein